MTFKLTNAFPKHNFLDTTHTFEQKFRLKLLNKSLAVNYNLHKRRIIDNPNCAFCDSIETVENLWDCQNSIDKSGEIIVRFHRNLQTRYTAKSNEALDLTSCTVAKGIFDYLRQDNSLQTTGIITHRAINQIKQVQLPSPLKALQSKSRSEILLMVLNCWYNAIYRTIWIPSDEQSCKSYDKSEKTKPKQPRRHAANPPSTPIIPSKDLVDKRKSRLHQFYRCSRTKQPLLNPQLKTLIHTACQIIQESPL
jgi:hypothetical protein